MSDISFKISWVEIVLIFGWPGLLLGAALGGALWRGRRLAGALAGCALWFAVAFALKLM